MHYVVPPGKRQLTEGGYGGLVRFRVAAAGTYRISVDQPFWVDIIVDGAAIRSKDFQGQKGCSAPHKVVEFVLPADKELLLQFGNTAGSHARFTITSAG
jgi:hypothetical protein